MDENRIDRARIHLLEALHLLEPIEPAPSPPSPVPADPLDGWYEIYTSLTLVRPGGKSHDLWKENFRNYLEMKRQVWIDAGGLRKFIRDDIVQNRFPLKDQAPSPAPVDNLSSVPADLAQRVIEDMRRNEARHHLIGHTPPRDWGFTQPNRPGTVVAAHNPTGPVLLPWYNVCQVSGSGAHSFFSIEFANMRTWCLYGRELREIPRHDRRSGDHIGGYYPFGSDYWSDRNGSYGGNLIQWKLGHNLHGWTARAFCGRPDGVFVQMAARVVGQNKDFAAVDMVVGVDPYAVDEGDPEFIRSGLAFSGRKRLTTEWQTVYAGTLSDVGLQEPSKKFTAPMGPTAAQFRQIVLEHQP